MDYSYDTQIFSDLHKDAFGFRPNREHRFYRTEDPDTKQREWDWLLTCLRQRQRDEELREQRAIAEFESHVAENIVLGAGDRATAIRWAVQALEPTEADRAYGGQYLCYDFGLPNSYAAELQAALDEL